jgi:hypothetical protein
LVENEFEDYVPKRKFSETYHWKTDMLVLVVGAFYTWFAYGKAKQRGRNPIRWALLAAATFLGTQLLVAGGIGFILGLGEDLWGWSANLINDYNLHITIVSLLACIVTNWLVLRPLNNNPKESFTEPPPPPKFN